MRIIPLPGTGTTAFPEPLRQFLAAGPPPVYMTIGSMMAADPSFQETTRLFTGAARLAGCRAIIQTDRINPGDGVASPDILYLDRAEHHRVFPGARQW